MMKITKKNHKTFLFKAKYITFCTIKSVLITAAVMIGMKWLGRLLEIISDHVSVGAGIFVIFVLACFFIYIDTRNSIDQADENNKMFVNDR